MDYKEKYLILTAQHQKTIGIFTELLSKIIDDLEIRAAMAHGSDEGFVVDLSDGLYNKAKDILELYRD